MGDTELWALKKISLDIHKGDFIAIMGRSGSGKSTLLNILGCLDLPTEGVYKINGILVSSLNDAQLSKLRNKYIGFVFQNFNLLPQLTVEENVELPLLYGEDIPSRDERRRRCRELLEMVGLGDRLHHRPNQLSGGQMQRAAIARALVTEPSLILADEPTGSLDSATSRDIMAMLREMNRQGRTIILVTHDPQVATNAHTEVHISDGLIKEVRRNEPSRAN